MNEVTYDRSEYNEGKSKVVQKDFSDKDLEEAELLTELRDLRIENEILKERLIQIKELTSI